MNKLEVFPLTVATSEEIAAEVNKEYSSKIISSKLFSVVNDEAYSFNRGNTHPIIAVYSNNADFKGAVLKHFPTTYFSRASRVELLSMGLLGYLLVNSVWIPLITTGIGDVAFDFITRNSSGPDFEKCIKVIDKIEEMRLGIKSV